MGFKKILAICLVISLFGGAGLGGGYAVVNSIISNNKNSVSEVPVPQETLPPSVSENKDHDKEIIKPNYNENKVSTISTTNSAVDVINQVFPSIVNITIGVTGSANYWGMIIPYESEGAGSGVIFDEDEEYVYIVTNNHVVGDADTISVSVTGIESIPAHIVGTDPSNDIAVIKA
jgi:serine protease Do